MDFRHFLFVLLSLLSLQSCVRAQQEIIISEMNRDSIISVKWEELAPGILFCETDAPMKSIVNDSKLSLFKLDPKQFEFEMHMATALDRTARTAPEWAEQFNLNIVLNAGMYELTKKLMSRGYLRHKDHSNNSKIHPTFNSMIAFNPKDTTQASFQVYDLQCHPWEEIKKHYHTYAQGLRMLDCNGSPIAWNKRQQACSMLVTAMDQESNIYFIYCRSPYTHNEMISFMRKLPFKLNNAIYMEGGPETSLYINIGGKIIQKMGSYVSNSYPNDLNDHFWTLPNIIGLRYKGNIAEPK